MGYGYEVYNASGNLVASSEDRCIAGVAKYTMNYTNNSQTNWYEHDYIPGYNYAGNSGFGPNKKVWDGSDGHPAYRFTFPSDLTITDDMLFGFNVPYSKSVWATRLYFPAGRLIWSDYPTITMIVARMIQPSDNAGVGYGMAVYDQNGDVAYHSNSKILRILKNIDGAGTVTGTGYTPFYFMTGIGMYYRTSSSYLLGNVGVRIDSETGYTRRLIGNGNLMSKAAVGFDDPLAKGFIAAVDTSLF